MEPAPAILTMLAAFGEGRRPAQPCACVEGRPAPVVKGSPTWAPIGWDVRTHVRTHAHRKTWRSLLELCYAFAVGFSWAWLSRHRVSSCLLRLQGAEGHRNCAFFCDCLQSLTSSFNILPSFFTTRLNVADVLVQFFLSVSDPINFINLSS